MFSCNALASLLCKVRWLRQYWQYYALCHPAKQLSRPPFLYFPLDSLMDLQNARVCNALAFKQGPGMDQDAGVFNALAFKNPKPGPIPCMLARGNTSVGEEPEITQYQF